MSFDVGTRCWYPSKEHGWIGCLITKNDFSDGIYHLEIKLESGELISIDTPTLPDTNSAATATTVNPHTSSSGTAKGPILPVLRNPPILEATDDLTSLSYLNEPAVLHAIKERYLNHNIYTYSGIVLIATNPFDRVDELYSLDMVHKYSQQKRDELDPHLFAIADEAYKRMIADGQNQTIIVTGESGAGKTVSAKYIMRFFASIETEKSLEQANLKHQVEMSEIEQKILATNPILEAFGNAKTTRNDNSSRFGKYLEILFSSDTKIIGARIRTYLLERSRLVFQPASERNYHIFYQILRGLPTKLMEELKLGDPSEFNYTNQGGETFITGVDDKAEYETTTRALELVGIDEAQQHEIFKLLAALLHIGNIEIRKSRSDPSLSSEEPNLVIACQLLGLDPVNFAKWIVKKQINTRSEKIVSSLNYTQALVSRDSFAKFIYTTLFDWLVQTINGTLCSSDPAAVAAAEQGSFIGVLDIYGFEHFEKNSFEQFCINYANEKLQQQFNQHVFKLEQEEYIRENIEWSFIEFNDNQPCIDLIENKLGILSLLDEESRLPAGSDESWTAKLYQTFTKPPSNQVFSKPRFGTTKFVVSHYADDITYDVEGFIEKNKDTVSEGHLEVLKATTNPTLKQILDNFIKGEEALEQAKKMEEEEQAASLKAPVLIKRKTIQRKPTLGSIFRDSLTELMNTIKSTNVHYIRCIKPNSEKASWTFDNLMVLSQLRACGVLETIRISCAGFPSRWTFDEFVQRYYFLTSYDEWDSTVWSNHEELTRDQKVEFIKKVLSRTITDEQKYQIGKTKIFFKAGMLAYLEKLRSDKLAELCVRVQKKIRGLNDRRWYLQTVQSIKNVQAYSRSTIIRARVDFELKTRAATLIQSLIRGITQLRLYTQALESAIGTQSVSRGKLTRLAVEEMRRQRASTLIQSGVRACTVRKYYRDLKKASIVVQSFARRRMARIYFEELKEQSLWLNSEEAKLWREFADFAVTVFDDLQKSNADYAHIVNFQRAKFQTGLEGDLEYIRLQDNLNTARKELAVKEEKIKHNIANYELWKESIRRQHKQLESIVGDNLDITQLASLREGVQTVSKRIGMFSDALGKLREIDIKTREFSSTRRQSTVNTLGNEKTTDRDAGDELSKLLRDPYTLITEIHMEILSNVDTSAESDDLLLPSTVINYIIQRYESKKLYGNISDFTNGIISVLREIFSSSLSDRKILTVAIYWLVNILAIYTFVSKLRVTGNADMVLNSVKNSCANLLSDCYNRWLKGIVQMMNHKYKLSEIVVGSQAGVNVGKSPKDISNLMNLFSEIRDAVTKISKDENITKRILLDITKCIDVSCFNDFITRFFKVNWQLGVNIDQRTDEVCAWFKSNSVGNESLMPHLKQAARLLQLRMESMEDFEMVSEFCFLLNPLQMQTILKKYKPNKYEAPIPAEVMNHLTLYIKKRNMNNTAAVLLPNETHTLADLNISVVSGPDISVCAEKYNSPTFKKLVGLVNAAAA